MTYYDSVKRKWVAEQEPSGWSECLVGTAIFILFLVGLFGSSL